MRRKKWEEEEEGRRRGQRAEVGNYNKSIAGEAKLIKEKPTYITSSCGFL